MVLGIKKLRCQVPWLVEDNINETKLQLFTGEEKLKCFMKETKELSVNPLGIIVLCILLIDGFAYLLVASRI